MGWKKENEEINGERKKRGSSVEIWTGSVLVMMDDSYAVGYASSFMVGMRPKKWIDGFD